MPTDTPETNGARRINHFDQSLPRYIVDVEVAENLERQRNEYKAKLAALHCSQSSVVEFLRRYNRWRRGKEDWDDLQPEEVGRMIDAACDAIDAVDAIKSERDEWKKEASEMADAFCCFRCLDAHTPLYCLNCADELSSSENAKIQP